MTGRGKAEALLFATTLIWGGTFVIVKVGLIGLSPFLMVALRFSLAAFFLLPFCVPSLLQIERADLLRGCGLGGLLFVGFILQTIGLGETTAGKSAFITSMMVIFTPLFQAILLNRMPRRENVIGVLIVSVGLWFLTSPEGGGLNRGDLFTLLCALVFGLYIVLLDPVSRRCDSLALTFLQIASPAVYGWIALFFLETPRFSLSWEAVFVLAYMIFPATILTGYIQTRYQRDTTPTRTVLIFSIEPVWAAILGFLFLKERLTPWGMIGAGLVVLGILFSEMYGLVGGNRLSREADPLRR